MILNFTILVKSCILWYIDFTTLVNHA